MNVPFAVAGALALAAAAVHGGLGQRVVIARLPRLEPTMFGGPAMTRLMVVVTWHIVTLAFAVLGAGLGWCAAADAEACRGVGWTAAAAFGGSSLLATAVAASAGRLRPSTFARHPGPLLMVAVAVCAWWGA